MRFFRESEGKPKDQTEFDGSANLENMNKTKLDTYCKY